MLRLSLSVQWDCTVAGHALNGYNSLEMVNT
jgi:hypothetical protein